MMYSGRSKDLLVAGYFFEFLLERRKAKTWQDICLCIITKQKYNYSQMPSTDALVFYSQVLPLSTNGTYRNDLLDLET